MQRNADIKELAVAAWRLERWLDNLNSDRKLAAKSALRGIKKYIAALEVEVVDPVGAKFDPGLAIEVVNNESPDSLEEELIIIETLTPYVYQNGELIQHARVIIGTLVKEAKVNNEIKETADEKVCFKESPAEETDASLAEPQACTSTEDDEDIAIGQEEIERMLAYAKIL